MKFNLIAITLLVAGCHVHTDSQMRMVEQINRNKGKIEALREARVRYAELAREYQDLQEFYYRYRAENDRLRIDIIDFENNLRALANREPCLTVKRRESGRLYIVPICAPPPPQ